jgi:NADH:ubiquinone oxidoreductase subunit 5 (subunit L)/multisubunit Na+/H+ antiporter MnhA subunit
VSRHAETAQQVPDDPVGPGDTEAIENGPEEVALVKEGNARLQLLSILPILLGVFILALNIFEVALIPWPFVSKSFNGGVVIALVTISAFIGLFLIVYSMVLLRFERNRSKESMTDDPRQASWYVKWVVVPLVLGLLASVATLKALERNSDAFDPIPHKPCLALYQEAASIRKDNPRFWMPSGDSDEVRCGINKTVLG